MSDLGIITNADEVALWLEEHAGAAVARQGEITAAYGEVLLAKIQQNVDTQFPGGTGHYKDSWGLEVEIDPLFARAVVGSDDPAARRHEFGYHDTDSAGRHFSNPPHPAALPALEEVGPAWLVAMAEGMFE